MISIQAFAKEVEKEVKEYLLKSKIAAECEVIENVKNNNTIKNGIRIQGQENLLGVVIYLEQLYADYQKGKEMKEVVSDIIGIYNNNYIREGSFEYSRMKDFDEIRDNLRVKLINQKANKKDLQNIPHKIVEDLAVIYQLMMPSEPGKMEIGTVKITDQFKELWNVDLETLHNTAMENTKKLFKPTLKTMDSIMREIMTGEAGCDYFTDKEAFLQQEKNAMYVLTNEQKMFGAVNILYPEILSSITEVIPEGYYILPSSIHETILVPKKDSMSIKELGAMVREINMNEVAMEEILSDKVYEYDKEARSFKQAEEPIAREAKKEPPNPAKGRSR